MELIVKITIKVIKKLGAKGFLPPLALLQLAGLAILTCCALARPG
jgi:hypothetical protein